MKWEYKEYWISDEKEEVDFNTAYSFLHQSYWCKGISKELVKKSFDNSLCFSVHSKQGMMGFARVITDYVTFAYLADVFVLEEHRGQGLAQTLIKTILNHSELQGFRRWILGTKDAHGLYEKLGFKPLNMPDFFMEIHEPNLYLKATE